MSDRPQSEMVEWHRKGGLLTFYAEHERDFNDRFLLYVGGDVGHERQVFDQSAGFSFGCVARTQHSPLARLQRPRAADFACLLKLRGDSRHHTQCRDKTKA